jgi:hypothetical protein
MNILSTNAPSGVEGTGVLSVEAAELLISVIIIMIKVGYNAMMVIYSIPFLAGSDFNFF